MGDRGTDLAAALQRMQRVLSRLVERAEAAGAEGQGPPGLPGLKAEADLVSLAARTAERIVEMNKVMALETDAAPGLAPLAEAERAQLRDRVEKWIEARAQARLDQLLRTGAAGEGAARFRDESCGDGGGPAGDAGGGAGSGRGGPAPALVQGFVPRAGGGCACAGGDEPPSGRSA